MNYFILNPAAGKGKDISPLAEKIKEVCGARGVPFKIYMTRGEKDATSFVKNICEREEYSNLRFFACGGDGTLSETVTGAYGYANASVGVIPMGTGNDFVRNFTNAENFLDIGAQLDGRDFCVDLLSCNERFCINMINIGFDCEVVGKTAKLKNQPFMPAKLAYAAGVVLTLIKNPGVIAEMTVDGQNMGRHKYQLTTLANGSYCGGGFFSNPRSLLCDGKIDAMFISAVTRRRFISLVGKYKKGEHLNDTTKDIIVSGKHTSIEMIFDKPQGICFDGEIFICERLKVGILKSAVNFLVPAGSSPVCGVPEGLESREYATV